MDAFFLVKSFVTLIVVIDRWVGVALGLAGVLVVLWLTLRLAGLVRRLLGEPGIELVTRISGLLLAAIAVQLVADAVREFVSGRRLRVLRLTGCADRWSEAVVRVGRR